AKYVTAAVELQYAMRVASMVESGAVSTARMMTVLRFTQWAAKSMTEAAAFTFSNAVVKSAQTGSAENWKLNDMTKEFLGMFLMFGVCHAVGSASSSVGRALGMGETGLAFRGMSYVANIGGFVASDYAKK